jgi:hypothetical protein
MKVGHIFGIRFLHSDRVDGPRLTMEYHPSISPWGVQSKELVNYQPFHLLGYLEVVIDWQLTKSILRSFVEPDEDTLPVDPQICNYILEFSCQKSQAANVHRIQSPLLHHTTGINHR